MRIDMTAEQSQASGAPSTPMVLSVTDLRKVYGRTVAVDGVSFDVGRNEIVGLLGPNGAGKTTIINMVLGVLEPDAGTIRIEGVDIAAHRCRALERTNFAAVYAPLPGNLTVYHNLRVFGLLYAMDNVAKRIEEVLQQFDLERFRNIRCGVLSSGARIDDDLLTERLRKRIRQRARQSVVGKRKNHSDRTARIGLRLRSARHPQEPKRQQEPKATREANEIHGGSPSVVMRDYRTDLMSPLE